MLGPLAFLIPLLVAMSTIGTVLATAFANSRLLSYFSLFYLCTH